MARKHKRSKNASVWMRLYFVLFRPWVLFERSAFWNMLLDHYCMNNFERNHCEGNARPSSESVDVYRFEFVFFMLLLVLVLQPGVTSTWISIPPTLSMAHDSRDTKCHQRYIWRDANGI